MMITGEKKIVNVKALCPFKATLLLKVNMFEESTFR